MSYPEYQDLEEPLLLFIYSNGGSNYQVRAIDTYEPLAEHFGLTEREKTQSRHEVHQDGREEPVWNNMVQWARRKLKDKGYLTPSPRGTWKLSEEGVLAAK